MKDEASYSWLFGDIEIRAEYFNGQYDKVSLPILYHEYFHAIQNQYCNRFTMNMWFCEATSSYYEAAKNGETSTAATEATYNMVFESLFPIKNNAKAGYARAPLIAYMCQEKENDGWIKTILETGAKEEDIKKIASDLSTSFQNEYYEALALGKVGNKQAFHYYKDIKEGVVGNGVGTVYTLTIPETSVLKESISNSETLTLGTAELTLDDSGARYIALTVDKDEAARLPQGTVLCIRSENSLLSILRFKGKNAESISYAIDDFASSVADGYQYLIVVSGYGTKGKTDKATISITASIPEPAIKSISFKAVADDDDLSYPGYLITKYLSSLGDIKLDNNHCVILTASDLTGVSGDGKRITTITNFRLEMTLDNQSNAYNGTVTFTYITIDKNVPDYLVPEEHHHVHKDGDGNTVGYAVCICESHTTTTYTAPVSFSYYREDYANGGSPETLHFGYAKKSAQETWQSYYLIVDGETDCIGKTCNEDDGGSPTTDRWYRFDCYVKTE